MAQPDETVEEVETPEAEASAEETPAPKDRTSEQFDKLKQSNQELKEERDQYKNLFESLRPSEVPVQTQQTYQQPINQAPNAQNFANLSQGDVNQVFQSMVDENGYLDGQKLMSTLQAMSQRAERAEQAAVNATKQTQTIQQSLRQKEETQAQQEVYNKYPALNPNDTDNFDPKFWDYVYNELAVKAKKGQMPSESDYMNAANKVYQDFYEGREDMTKKDKEKAKQTEDAKRQINATRPRSPMNVGYYANEEDNALVAKVQQGKKGAVAELLKRRGL